MVRPTPASQTRDAVKSDRESEGREVGASVGRIPRQALRKRSQQGNSRDQSHDRNLGCAKISNVLISHHQTKHSAWTKHHVETESPGPGEFGCTPSLSRRREVPASSCETHLMQGLGSRSPIFPLWQTIVRMKRHGHINYSKVSSDTAIQVNQLTYLQYEYLHNQRIIYRGHQHIPNSDAEEMASHKTRSHGPWERNRKPYHLECPQ